MEQGNRRGQAVAGNVDRIAFLAYSFLVPPLTLVLQLGWQLIPSWRLFGLFWACLWLYAALLVLLPPRRHRLLYLFVNSAVAGLLVVLAHQTGGALSPFQGFFILVALSGVFLRPWQAVFIAVVAATGYAAPAFYLHHPIDFIRGAGVFAPLLGVVAMASSFLFSAVDRLDHMAQEEQGRGRFREAYKGLISGEDTEAVARQAVSAVADLMECVLVAMFVPDGSGGLRVLAAAGPARVYLNEIALPLSREGDPLAMGPAGRAFRERRPLLVHDTKDDPLFVPWREVALRHGIRSTLSQPIVHEGRSFGVFAVYVSEPGAITPPRMRLLEEYAEMMALSFYKAHLLEDIQEQAHSLQEAHEYTESIFRAVGEGLCALDGEGRITLINPSGARILGYRPEELIGRPIGVLHARSPGGSEGDRPGPVAFTGSDRFRHKSGRGIPVTCISTPIRVRGQAVGTIMAFQDETERHAALEEIRRVNRQLNEVVDCASDLNLDASEEEACGTLLRHLGKLGNLGDVHLFRLAPGEPPRHAAGFSRRSTVPVLDPDRCPALRLDRLWVPDRTRTPGCTQPCLSPSAGSLYCRTLEHGAEPVTVVHLSARPIRFFDEAMVQRVDNILRFGGLVLGNLRTFDRHRLLSYTDPLTGLYNRRHLHQLLPAVARASRLSGRPYGVLMVDVDHFKRLNDTYGHDAGDRVLACLAEVLRELCRKTDHAFRMGGEEFLLLLEETSLEELGEVAERVRRRIAEAPMDLPDGPRITVSIGICTGPGEEGRETEVLRRADQALYRAKQAGRNRVAACGPEPQVEAGPPALPAGELPAP